MIKLNKMKKRKKQNGFSVVEMLIVLAIMLVLSGIFIGYNRTSGKQLVLYTEQTRVIGILNEAKSLALQKFKEDSVAEGYVVCAYGVGFEKTSVGNQYKIFNVLKQENEITCPINDDLKHKSVKIYEADVNVVVTTVSSPWVAFEAPYFKTYPETGMSIYINLADTSFQKSIKVGPGGTITPTGGE